MPLYWFSFLYAVILTWWFIPYSRQIGFKLSIVDGIKSDPQHHHKARIEPKNREKIHQKANPRTGGIAIFFGFWCAIVLSIGLSLQMFGIFLGSLFVFIIMLLDDRYCLKPAVKLMGQIVASIIPILFGVRIYFISNPLLGDYFAIGWLGIPLTIFWCVAFMNALNLIDGLDGLAGGIAAIAGIGMVIISIVKGVMITAIFGMAMVGACLAFLRFNFHPATIILGDNGAHLLGYLIAMISIWGGLKTSTGIILIASVLAIGVPAFDVIFSTVTRLRKHKKFYEADLENIHYQLHRKGWGQRRIAVLFYVITLLLCLVPILFVMR
ncbi:MAG: MraY family glycosyltransferase [Caldisericia bacterium]|nr:MraY family glycosyltransferase [Caldisericia bacterium]